MSSKIEWTEDTWNPLIGCDKVSPGCKNCYAIKTAWIRMHNPAMKEKYAGTVEKTAGGQLNWTGKVSMHEESLLKPLKARKPTVYFVNSMSDLFHESVPFEFIRTVFGVMSVCQSHTFQILTKRADRMLAFFEWLKENDPEMMDDPADYAYDLCTKYGLETGCGSAFITDVWPLKNVWLGVSVEDQKAAAERIPKLLQSPAAVRFLSCEPLLGPVNLAHIDADGAGDEHYCQINALTGRHTDMARPCQDVPCIDWVIAGGESGPGARPMHPDWARSLRDQCAGAGVPYFFKQWGNYLPIDQPWQQDGPKGLAANEQWLNRDGGQGFHGQEVYRMRNVGKKAAGRLLDGQLHNAYPLSCAPLKKANR